MSYEATVSCCGDKIPADFSSVREAMISHKMDARQQALEWRRLAAQYADPDWMEECIAMSEKMVRLWQRECEIDRALGQSENCATGADGRKRPLSPLAVSHFEWLGDRQGSDCQVQASTLRGGIANLAEKDYISRDQEQQDAMRRGLGLALNAGERSSQAPWVIWLGDGAALNYIIDSLWRMGLIHCSGGQKRKWQTLCGIFLRSDGTLFTPAIKSNRCTNKALRSQLDRAFLNALRPRP